MNGFVIVSVCLLVALTDSKETYYHSHHDLLEALNQRLNTSYRDMKPLAESLQRERAAKGK